MLLPVGLASTPFKVRHQSIKRQTKTVENIGPNHLVTLKRHCADIAANLIDHKLAAEVPCADSPSRLPLFEINQLVSQSLHKCISLRLPWISRNKKNKPCCYINSSIWERVSGSHKALCKRCHKQNRSHVAKSKRSICFHLPLLYL